MIDEILIPRGRVVNVGDSFVNRSTCFRGARGAGSPVGSCQVAPGVCTFSLHSQHYFFATDKVFFYIASMGFFGRQNLCAMPFLNPSTIPLAGLHHTQSSPLPPVSLPSRVPSEPSSQGCAPCGGSAFFCISSRATWGKNWWPAHDVHYPPPPHIVL